MVAVLRILVRLEREDCWALFALWSVDFVTATMDAIPLGSRLRLRGGGARLSFATNPVWSSSGLLWGLRFQSLGIAICEPNKRSSTRLRIGRQGRGDRAKDAQCSAKNESNEKYIPIKWRMTMCLIIRSVFVWILLLSAAILNGAFREKVLVPLFGSRAAHWTSTVLLCLLIMGIAGLMFAWLDVATRRESWIVGIVWILLTVAFEFLAGHFAFGKPWSMLLADYDIFSGRIWILVLVTTGLAPPLLYGWKR